MAIDITSPLVEYPISKWLTWDDPPDLAHPPTRSRSHTSSAGQESEKGEIEGMFNRGYMTVDHPENHGKHVSTVLYQPKNVDMIRKKYVLVDLLHLGFAYNKKIQM